MKKTLLVILSTFLICTRLIAQSTAPQVPRITNLFSADEAKKAGLAKLTPEEIAALNSAFFRVFVQLNSQLNTQSGNGLQMTIWIFTIREESRARILTVTEMI
jgi:hypothetical protein